MNFLRFFSGSRSALCGCLLVCCAVFSTPSPSNALLTSEINAIAVFEQVAPSVVNITTKLCEPESFFCIIPSNSGSGSGIVYSEDGAIVTNYHVVEGAQNIEVTFSDGRKLPAHMSAFDENDDLAVIRVDARAHALKAITLGDSDRVRTGEQVFAVGNPFGLGQTLTAGVVSMTGRDIRSDERIMRDLIQTDAKINPGNSGGALVDSTGKLIGVNTAIFSTTGGSVGIGFAVPANRVKRVASDLVSGGRIGLGSVIALTIILWIAWKIKNAGTERRR